MKLIIAEKPSVAAEIAKVVGARAVPKEGFFEGNGFCVSSAFGHLVGLADPEAYDESLKTWSLETLPILPLSPMRLVAVGDSGARARLSLLRKLIGQADEVIAASDAGREGELIFRNIWEFCGGRCKASRLWVSSMTDESLEKGLRNLRPLQEYDNLAAAAAARAEADWLVGMNGSRGYTAVFGAFGNILSIGRVQTPVLALIVARDVAIEWFRSTPFWEIIAEYRGGKFKRSAGRFEKANEAMELVDSLQGKPLVVESVEQKEKREKAPALFDLTELQREANKKRKIEAKKTLEWAQSLYEKKLITYPRTDSRYLSSDMVAAAREAIEVAGSFMREPLPVNIEAVSQGHRCFNDKKVSDHHAIIPTNQRALRFDSPDEEWIYAAICIRTLAAFSPDCVKSVTEVIATVGEEAFRASGVVIKEIGWRSFYQEPPKKNEDEETEESPIPQYVEKESGPCRVKALEGWTKPPLPYTEATLLTAMEQAGKEVEEDELKEALKERGLGTPSTRAGIIETLASPTRKYIEKTGGKLVSTPRGRALIAAIDDQALKSAELTGEWEFKLRRIERGELRAETFMEEVRGMVLGLVVNVKGKKGTAGNSTLAATAQRESLGPCPCCKKPVTEWPKSWSCGDRECGFTIWKEMFGKRLPKAAIQDLVKYGKTGLIEGFISKKTGKKFDSRLEWNEDTRRVEFVFETKAAVAK